MPSGASCGTLNVHSALLQALSVTVRASISRDWLSRSVTSTFVPGGSSCIAVRRVGAGDELEVHFLAELVHAAIREDVPRNCGSASERSKFEVELPRREPFGPVAADVGDVAVFLRR